MTAALGAIPVERLDVAVYRVPTERRESDGTFEWDATTAVVVHAHAGGRAGLGWSYTHATAARVISEDLAAVVRGRDALDVQDCWVAMRRALRNVGTRGIAAGAISAVDTALWDLKARVLGVALARLFGSTRERVPVYGSGGFTSYTVEELRTQLTGWTEAGIRMVKMKVGRDPPRDPERVRAARAAIGPGAELFVDANGAYSRKEALAFARTFAEEGVGWFEEPVSSEDLEGLRLVRDRAPAGMSVAAGEYGWDPVDLRRLLDAGAVDVLQPDATRCGGFTGFLRAAALCEAHGVPLSAHTAPALHVHACCAAPVCVHLEYFHDHVRLETLLFDGVPRLENGALAPDRGRPGNGLELKRSDAGAYRI